MKKTNDDMKELYRQARINMSKKNGLQKENIIDMVNTIIRRKRLHMTVC